MNALFGISMTTIMLWLVALLAICLLIIGVIAVTNPTMVKMGLRNIPRRKATSTLVVLGLMLATLIISAAFTTGDSIDYSITRDVYQILGPIDETIELQGTSADAQAGQPYVDESVVTNLEQRFGDNPDIRGFIPAIQEPIPVFNPETNLSGPSMTLSGVDPARVDAVGGLRYEDGRPVDLAALPPDSVLLNPKSAEILDAQTGDTIQIIAGNEPQSFTVAGIARPELLTGWTTSGPGTRDNGGVTMTLAAAQELLDKPGQVNFIGIANTGGNREGVERSDQVVAALEPVLDNEAERAALGFADVSVEVQAAKQDSLEEAVLIGNVFTTVFLVLGLFSIAAGVLLIFMIFVMLAAERKTEMGMSRAVGLKRRHLIQSFAAEGMAYNLLAGLVGAALGVLAAWALVWASGALFGDSFAMDLQITPRSLVISYALGVVLTFITVVVSAWRVSKLNIVAAIRDVQEDRGKRAGRGTLIWGIIGALISALCIAGGQSSDSLFLFTLGMTLIFLSGALILRFFGFAPRPVFTIAGALIFLFWSLPTPWFEGLFGELSGDFEMFFLSGVGMVLGSTLVLVYNANLLTNLFQGGHGRGFWAVPLVLGAATVGLAVAGVLTRDSGQGISQMCYMAAGLAGMLFVLSLFASRAERFRPALKMAIAYPLASRFRTGMTIAMFSLIVFSITVMSIITQSFADLFVADTARAGWDLTAIVNRNNPLPDFRAALVESDFSDPDRVRAIGRTTFPTGEQEARVAGNEEWKEYPIIAADDGYFENISAEMIARARGYDSDEAVWEAVRTQPGVAVVDGFSLVGGFGSDPSMFRLTGEIERDDMSFEPVTVQIHDPITERTTDVTIIGVVDDQVSQSVLWGIYTNPETYQAVFGQPRLNRVFMTLAPGADPAVVNREIRATMVASGVDSYDLKAELEDQQRLQIGFNYIFQGFMGLGLFVGVAALGVIAFRAVVERRQQIGMLRALGFQKGTVALSFILESSFISVMGVLAGLIGATILARDLFYSGAITDTGSIDFQIPWVIVIGFLVAGIGFALLMTWLPARRAASVPIAEALRYE